ncbi:MAG: phosphate acyltransferase [Succinivibrio sp.]|nr:phosphate acyltransferase [Succinivibrio sp.]
MNSITVALDGTGGDPSSTRGIVRAVTFALTMYPAMKLLIFGSSQLEADLLRANVSPKRFELRLAPQGIPQDEEPRRVLKRYTRSALWQAISAVKEGAADAVISGGGTGPIVTLARHILGTYPHMRPALCARMPSGPGHFSLMLDLGANSSCDARALADFAILGQECCRVLLGNADPRVTLLNVGSERDKGNELIRHARDLMEQERRLNFMGYLEADRIFTGDADVIVTDGFTGNVALKAAEGVAGVFTHVSGIKKLFAKWARPEWLLPWQYNGSLLLGVNGVVVKSHGSAGEEALAVAMVEAARNAELKLSEQIRERLF